MTARSLMFFFVLTAAVAFAQTSTPQAPPRGGTSQTGAGTASSSKPGAQGDMGAMHQQHMQDMQAQVEHFRTLLDKMKADAANIQDPAGKQLAQDNIDLWQAFFDHLQGMSQRMSGRGMGMHNMRRRGATPGATPSQTPPPPK